MIPSKSDVAGSRDYLERTIETVRVHRDSDNSWPQWANVLADEIERLWGQVEHLADGWRSEAKLHQELKREVSAVRRGVHPGMTMRSYVQAHLDDADQRIKELEEGLRELDWNAMSDYDQDLVSRLLRETSNQDKACQESDPAKEPSDA
jgi:hypothetical protein